MYPSFFDNMTILCLKKTTVCLFPLTIFKVVIDCSSTEKYDTRVVPTMSTSSSSSSTPPPPPKSDTEQDPNNPKIKLEPSKLSDGTWEIASPKLPSSSKDNRVRCVLINVTGRHADNLYKNGHITDLRKFAEAIVTYPKPPVGSSWPSDMKIIRAEMYFSVDNTATSDYKYAYRVLTRDADYDCGRSMSVQPCGTRVTPAPFRSICDLAACKSQTTNQDPNDNDEVEIKGDPIESSSSWWGAIVDALKSKDTKADTKDKADKAHKALSFWAFFTIIFFAVILFVVLLIVIIVYAFRSSSDSAAAAVIAASAASSAVSSMSVQQSSVAPPPQPPPISPPFVPPAPFVAPPPAAAVGQQQPRPPALLAPPRPIVAASPAAVPARPFIPFKPPVAPIRQMPAAPPIMQQGGGNIGPMMRVKRVYKKKK